MLYVYNIKVYLMLILLFWYMFFFLLIEVIVGFGKLGNEILCSFGVNEINGSFYG